ncbi:NB-ARC - like 10 [Theobroma cacao]|nr:NB-ARC - like 10 [Theobroma cacao]
MGPRIKEITERLDSVAADISKFNLSPRAVTDMKAKHTDRTTASKVRPEMIGNEKDKEHIIELLFREQNDRHGDNIFNIVASVGFGGLGKTTLAQLVYNEAEKTLESLGNSKMDDLDLDIYLKKLEENMRGKRYLLVLDDVRNQNNLKWDNLSKLLVFGAPGSKIHMTACSKKVAFTMGVNHPYLLECLNEDQSCALFRKVALQDDVKLIQSLEKLD